MDEMKKVVLEYVVDEYIDEEDDDILGITDHVEARPAADLNSATAPDRTADTPAAPPAPPQAPPTPVPSAFPTQAAPEPLPDPPTTPSIESPTSTTTQPRMG